ncbi:MAG: ATP-dependent metallopeptidase FtsH/Yme1/Tma family protein, partial [Candidatus Promineifilaceae bacterium]
MDEQQTSNQDQKKRRFPNIWWLILLALLLWNVWLIWPKGQAVADIPYTTFVKQVEADNVQQVKIQGDTITGQLDQPILWPQPTP